jgi:serine/threonine protein kinase/Flp pilus assembly protein TadD
MTTISHYRIVSRLGAGGMGEVYLAEDLTLDRKVAIKVLPADVAADAERKRRFVREAKAASALSHPNICVIHEVGETEGGQLFIVMEHVEGETLQRKIGQRPLETGELVRIALQAADAMEAAHAKGITHRDLKPSNLIVTARGQLKVLDFGLAKVASPPASGGTDQLTASKTDPAVVMGTVQYMSPEQALGRDVDPRSDVFSLGVVLYEMATGRLPFAGVTTTQTIEQIAHAQPEAIGRFNYDLPGEFERIVRKCLEKDRERRYQSARDLMVDLQNLQRDSDPGSVAAGRAGARRSESNRRWAIGALLVAVLAAGVGLYLVNKRGRDQAIDSVAVLPFTNQNNDPETEYLADGLAESIINNLSNLADLRVIARFSAFRYKGKENDPFGAGRELGVRAVVTGRVLQRGENLNVSAELVDVHDNKQIWGQQYYNRKLADMFAVQQEIAKDISEQLRVKLTGAEDQQFARLPTENLKAFQYYTKSRDFSQRRTREDLETAIGYCKQALAEDPNYALAYASMADAYQAMGVRGYLSPDEGMRRAEEFARKALALDEHLAEAHVALGAAYNSSIPANFTLGDRELRLALEMKPGLAAAHFYLGISLSRQGRLDAALEANTRAQQADPLSSINARNVAFVHYLKRDFPTAIRLLRRADDSGSPFSATWEIGVYVKNQLFDEALAGLRKAGIDRKNDPILIHSIGVVYAAQGKRAEALAIVRELEAMSGPNLSQAHWIARIHSTLNDRESALKWLERGFEARAIGAFFAADALWDPLRADPRFDDFLRRMGIPTSEPKMTGG